MNLTWSLIPLLMIFFLDGHFFVELSRLRCEKTTNLSVNRNWTINSIMNNKRGDDDDDDDDDLIMVMMIIRTMKTTTATRCRLFKSSGTRNCICVLGSFAFLSVHHT
jgi:hypothetical protein